MVSVRSAHTVGSIIRAYGADQVRLEITYGKHLVETM
jgi:hypothetical protein